MRDAAPFPIDDVLTARTLAIALDRLVINHPCIVELRQTAMRAAAAVRHPFYDNAGIIAPVYGHEEEMLALKHFAPKDYERLSDEQKENILANALSGSALAHTILKQGRRPREVERFQREFERYAQALFDVLVGGEVEVFCHNAADHHYQPVSSATWIREEFYVLPRTGDVFEAVGTQMKLRLKAIEFRRVEAQTSLPATSTQRRGAGKKTAPKEDALIAEITAKGLCRELGLTVVFSKISRGLQERFLSAAAGAKAVGRAFDTIERQQSAANIVSIKKARRPKR